MSAPAGAAGTARRSDGAAVAASSMVANALGALMAVVLAHSYGGAQFGGLAALLSVALVATVPATGLQYVITRRTARAQLGPGVHDRTSLRWAALLGAALSLLVCALAPLLSALLALPVIAFVMVGLSVAPYMINAAQLGTLLAQDGLRRFAAGQATLAGLRFLAVAVACATGASVTGVIVWLVVATWLAVACCAPLIGIRGWSATLPGGADYAREILRATLGLAGISVVMNIDVLLARHFLSPADSGMYALGSLFAKASLWAAQFIPQLIFSKISLGGEHRILIRRAVTADIAVGALVLAAAVVLARPVLTVVSGGADPVAAAHLSPLFAVLGTGWAVAYLVLLASVATGNPTPGRALWAVVLAELGAVVLVWHDSPIQILGTVIVGTSVLAAFGAISAWRAAIGLPVGPAEPLSAPVS